MKKIKPNFKKPINGWKRLSKKKKIITSTVAVVMVCVVTVSIIFTQKSNGDQLPQSTVQTAEVTTGNISNTIVGTGTLQADASDSITVPSGITIKKVKVESGDAVSKGDTLATVDTTSVLSAIETVQKEIETLDEKINECKDSDETENVTAKISGTVKKIYVKEGESVTDCIAENGALLVITVDGNSDEKLEITASGGTVSEIHVSKKEQVSAGDVLLTITKNEESTEYKQLMAKRKALAESLQKLTSMAKTGKIVADIDGTVGEINVSDGSESSVSTTSVGSATTGNSVNKGISASQMSYTTGGTTEQTLSTTKTVSAVPLNSTSSTIELAEEGISSENKKIQLKVVDSGNSTQSSLVLEVPKVGNIPQSEIKTSDGSYEGKVTWNPTDSVFASGTTYSADVTLTAADGFVFGTDSITALQTGIVSGTKVSEDGKMLTFHVTFPTTEEEKSQQQQEETTTSQISGSSKEQGTAASDNKISEAGENTKVVENSNTSKNNNTFSSSGTGTILQTGGTSIKTTSSSTSGTQSTSSSNDTDSESSSYSNEVTAFTLASNDSMVLSVNVDELDINSVSKGQEANITLDAIENKTFTGTVTKVGNSASSSSSGVAKYTVEVTVPKDEQMKTGMNASATIIIENKENILTIPVNALQERRDKTFVYTQQDEEGNLSGEIEITTGLSDGDNVEIVEGLSEGDTVYYQKTGKTSTQQDGGMNGGGHGGYGNKGDMQGGANGKGGFNGMQSGERPAGIPGGNE